MFVFLYKRDKNYSDYLLIIIDRGHCNKIVDHYINTGNSTIFTFTMTTKILNLLILQ
jgi:hypothetical protein